MWFVVDWVHLALVAIIGTWAGTFVRLGWLRHGRFGTVSFHLGLHDQGLWLPSRGRQPSVPLGAPALPAPHPRVVIFETRPFRVPQDTGGPGIRTTPPAHPDRVMYTLTPFRRRLHSGDIHRDIELAAGQALWVPAQRHVGANTGDAPPHTTFVEHKEPPVPPPA